MTHTTACMQHATAMATTPSVQPNQSCCKVRNMCKSEAKRTADRPHSIITPQQGCCMLRTSDCHQEKVTLLRQSCPPAVCQIPHALNNSGRQQVVHAGHIMACSHPVESFLAHQLHRCISCCCSVTAAAEGEANTSTPPAAVTLTPSCHSEKASRLASQGILGLVLAARCSSTVAALLHLPCCSRSVGKGEEAVSSEGRGDGAAAG